MNGHVLALRKGLVAHLGSDAALVAAMGGALRLHDEPPRDGAPLYATFGDARADDWSGEGVDGCEHAFTIVVHARPGSAAQALAVADRIAALLHGASPSLEGHRVANMRLRGLDVGRGERGGQARATLRLRAVTERL